MTSTSPTCSYSQPFVEECALPSGSGGSMCVLHEPDLALKDWHEFLATLKAKIERENRDPDPSHIIDLSGVVFPPDFDWAAATAGINVVKGIHFERATFSGDAHFGNATFSGDAHFLGATFNGDANLSYATFKGTLRCEGTRFPSQGSEKVVNFQAVTLEKPDEVLFQDCDLARVSFLGTDVQNVRFIGAKWPKKVELWWLLPFVMVYNNVVFDHLELERKSGNNTSGNVTQVASPVLVGELYRQLRMNYERGRREIEARYFYIGQMDMRLRDSQLHEKDQWYYRWLLRNYRWLALYGESIFRPMQLYFLLGFLLAFVYLWGGFSYAGRSIHYPLTFPPDWAYLGSFLAAYAEGWFVSMTAGAFPGRELAVVAPWLRVVQVFNIVADILLIALFVIALRRQFRR